MKHYSQNGFITGELTDYAYNRKNHICDASDFRYIWERIIIVLNDWTGNTWVGIKKEKNRVIEFQKFFIALHELIIFLQNLSDIDPIEKDFVNKAIYHGYIYRYLGSGKVENEKIIKPKFNNIYVSWSKNSTSCYIEGKLYGPITWIACNIEHPYFGIDLEKIGGSRGNEKEVVFPTIKKFVTEIKYISEEDND